MCGIAGLICKPETSPDAIRERVIRMRDAMTHRGPDDAGIFVSPDQRVALANRRLAIRDLSPHGHMPMCAANGRLALTYNGELYNADDLRAELQRAGQSFFSTSDTEVILRGYAQWGEAMFARLRGIFALAFYDGRDAGAARVLLARDPLGVKPLYYARTDTGLLFASELKALRASGWVSSEIEPAALVGYLMLGAVPTPRTIYREIAALEPGAVLVCALATMETRITRYWSLPGAERVTHGDVVAETRAALLDAVRSQLVSDVPLGAFLSGGLDSSAVVALMRQTTNGALRTCSMVFEEAEYSEAPYARAVAEQVGAEHFERVVTAQDVLNEMPRVVWALDQPSVDGVNSYFVSQTARQAGLTVALSGLGGDELFGGYPTFYAAPRLMRQMRRVQNIPFGADAARAALAFLPRAERYAKVRAALAAPASPASAYLAYRGLFAPSEVKQLVSPDIWNAARDFDPTAYVEERAGGDTRYAIRDTRYAIRDTPFAWTTRAELSTYTLNQLLRDTDAMSMAHSLEVRVPLLDNVLVEKILSLPAHAKQNGGAPKALLRQAIGDLLPPLVRERRAKQGFTFPFARWLRGDLKKYFAQFAPEAGGYLRADASARVLNAFERGDVHWSRAWALLVLRSWMAQNENK